MALQVQELERKFQYIKDDKTLTLDDPNPELSIEEVLMHYSNTNSEFTTATIDGPKIENNFAIYDFKTTVGTKG